MRKINEMNANSTSLLRTLQKVPDGNVRYTKPEQHAELLNLELVEVNPNMINEHGLATRLTEKGKNMNTQAYEIEDNVSLPKIQRGARLGSSKYPFDQLDIGQSFHVPATEDCQTPEKSLASVTSNTNGKYKENVMPPQTKTIQITRHKRNPDGSFVEPRVYETIDKEVSVTRQTRKFVCRRAGDDDPKGAGARIFRVPV